MGNLCGGQKKNMDASKELDLANQVKKSSDKVAATAEKAATNVEEAKKNLPPGLQNAMPKKKKLNRADYMFQDKDGETLTKRPGDIDGLQFKIKDLKNCNIYLLDHIAELSVDRCHNCTFFVGPVKASIFFRDSSNCKMTVACSQFRCRDLTDTELQLFTPNDPIIESSSKLTFAPFNFKYGLLHSHAEKANLLGEFVNDDGITLQKINKWSQVFDFTKQEELNFSLVDPSDWSIVTYEDLGMEELPKTGEEDDFIFDLPVEFGGTIDQEMLQAQSSQHHKGMMAFDIKAGAQQAAQQFQQKYGE